VLAGIAAASILRPAVAAMAGSDAPPKDDGGPVFSASGPDAEHYGAPEGFPI